jgi:hypothetical protein
MLVLVLVLMLVLVLVLDKTYGGRSPAPLSIGQDGASLLRLRKSSSARTSTIWEALDSFVAFEKLS